MHNGTALGFPECVCVLCCVLPRRVESSRSPVSTATKIVFGRKCKEPQSLSGASDPTPEPQSLTLLRSTHVPFLYFVCTVSLVQHSGFCRALRGAVRLDVPAVINISIANVCERLTCFSNVAARSHTHTLFESLATDRTGLGRSSGFEMR